MINIYTDGACSKNGSIDSKAGIGVVIEWVNKPPTIHSEYIGEGYTNNETEYKAFLKALEYVYHKQIMNVKILSDSNLMVQQVNGNWRCKDKKLKKLLDLANRRLKWFKDNKYNVELEYIRREFNLADEPAKNGYLNEK